MVKFSIQNQKLNNRSTKNKHELILNCISVGLTMREALVELQILEQLSFRHRETCQLKLTVRLNTQNILSIFESPVMPLKIVQNVFSLQKQWKFCGLVIELLTMFRHSEGTESEVCALQGQHKYSSLSRWSRDALHGDYCTIVDTTFTKQESCRARSFMRFSTNNEILPVSYVDNEINSFCETCHKLRLDMRWLSTLRSP